MTSKTSASATVWAVTHAVHDWLLFTDPNSPAIEGAMRIIRGRGRLADATWDLEAWFLERLTVDPGMPGPFSGVARELLKTVLGLVDWELIVMAMRQRED